MKNLKRTILDQYDVSGGNTSVTYGSLQEFTNVSIQVTGTGLNAADSTVDISIGNDNVNFAAIPETLFTLPIGGSTFVRELLELSSFYIKVSFTANSSTVGTLDIILTAKGI